MKRNILFKCWALLVVCLISVGVSAEDYLMKSGSMEVTLSETGHYRSIRIGSEEVLAQGSFPLAIAVWQGQLIEPHKAVVKGRSIHLTMEDNQVIQLRYARKIGIR